MIADRRKNSQPYSDQNSESAVSSALKTAIDYANIGLRILPVHGRQEDGNCTCGDASCMKAAKHPIEEATPHGWKDATTDRAKLEEWFARYPWANLAASTVADELTLCVIDVDPRNGGDATLAALESEFGKLPPGPRVSTGGGGEHIWCRVTQEYRDAHGGLLPRSLRGIDIKCAGVYVVVPRSIHASGQAYEWSGLLSSLESLPLIPQWWPAREHIDAGGTDWTPQEPEDGIERLWLRAKRRLKSKAIQYYEQQQPDRSSALWHLELSLFESGCNRDDVYWLAATSANRKWNDKGLAEDVLRAEATFKESQGTNGDADESDDPDFDRLAAYGTWPDARQERVRKYAARYFEGDLYEALMDDTTWEIMSPAKDRKLAEKPKKSPQQQLIEIVDKQCLVWHDGQEVYVTFDGRHYPAVGRGSGALRDVLSDLFDQAYGQSLGDRTCSEALSTVRGKARRTQEPSLYMARLAYIEGTIYFDLGRQRFVRIDSEGWKCIGPAELPTRVKFRDLGIDLPEPERGGTLDLLFNLHWKGVDGLSVPLMKAHLLDYMRPEGPHPPLALLGSPGITKTSTARIFLWTYGEARDVGTRPKDSEQYLNHASQHRIVCIDNINTLPPWLSDLLSQTATGAEDYKKKLYTDNDEFRRQYMAQVIVTGINLSLGQPDFVDRTTVVTLKKPERFIPDRELLAEFDSIHGKLLGAIFDATARALNHRGQESAEAVSGDNRMAGFEEWAIGAGIEGFTEAYKRNRSHARRMVIELSPLSQWILRLAKRTRKTNDQTLLHSVESGPDEKGLYAGRGFIGQTSALWEMLRTTGLAGKPGMPNTPQHTSSMLLQMAPNLMAEGVSVIRIDGDSLLGMAIGVDEDNSFWEIKDVGKD